MKKTSVTLLAASILSLAPIASAVSFQDLTYGYDVFVRGDATLDGASIHGSIATGGSLILDGNQSLFSSRPNISDYVIASKQIELLSTGNGGQMASNLDTNAIRVESLSAGQSIDASGFNDANTGKKINFQPPQTGSVGSLGIDFSSSFSAFSALSNALKNTAATLDLDTDIPDKNNWNYALGTSGMVDVISLTAAELLTIKSLNFTALAGATDKLIINVDLTGFAGTLSNTQNGEEAADHILWNFYGNSFVNLENQFVGSILAVDTSVNHHNNQIKGMVVADSFNKSGGQVHVHRIEHDIPEVPDTGSTALMTAIALPMLALLRRKLR
ncbi:VPDSG-CTERM sorting domain-containing protein [Pelagicoccus sp. NFK12]|uniref:VPDSG-CTERM sorting domain-containing protein n=1 Tax=Pelagicoccus enzymogenes TaxID=2773457 RepID=A0A927F854_9BACT|nr:VPDSG-CTERM sorting domain-containing protein [Pelagicoccus enzymogenes]MBD5779695.1 VPDSG-CTERM sorting domain-containing protein [Pelagicoccus enzymogenes]MDQ8199325.1 VPDSG-CTERM sorting domain-containing protein [Pelagicoccus enzymogenes]